MLIATLAASFLPRLYPFSAKRLAQIQLYSIGLLIGAALTIVIPEGVAAVYTNTVAEGHHDEHDHHEGGHKHAAHSNAAWIGISLLAGFILMFIIESFHSHDVTPPRSRPAANSSNQPSFYRTSSSASELEPLARNTEDLSPNRSSEDAYDWAETGFNHRSNSRDRNSSANSPERKPVNASNHSSRTNSNTPASNTSAISTVIGLVVHSLADGISLGASSLATATPNDPSAQTLDLIIFFAIMVHKAPAAFALSSLLSTSAYTSPSFTRKSLFAFSFAAPLGAILTFSLLSLIGAEGGAGIGWWTGIALVFSGGTFLFVATSNMKQGEEIETDAETESNRSKMKIKLSRMFLVMGGMITPFTLSRIVGHGH